MNKEQIKDLNEIRKYLEISEEDFIKIIALAKMRQKRSNIIISDEMLYQIITEALLGIDYDIEDNKNDFSNPYFEKTKSIDEVFLRAIRNLDF